MHITWPTSPRQHIAAQEYRPAAQYLGVLSRNTTAYPEAMHAETLGSLMAPDQTWTSHTLPGRPQQQRQRRQSNHGRHPEHRNTQANNQVIVEQKATLRKWTCCMLPGWPERQLPRTQTKSSLATRHYDNNIENTRFTYPGQALATRIKNIMGCSTCNSKDQSDAHLLRIATRASTLELDMHIYIRRVGSPWTTTLETWTYCM